MSSGDKYCLKPQLKSLFNWELSQCFGQLTQMNNVRHRLYLMLIPYLLSGDV